MIRLTRLDPDQNMRRYYGCHLQPSMLGTVDLVREWGRLGKAGTIRVDRYASDADARAALAETVRRKTRRGYAMASGHSRSIAEPKPCTGNVYRCTSDHL
jgi:predicted DNA-binding WGR domain protein